MQLLPKTKHKRLYLITDDHSGLETTPVWKSPAIATATHESITSNTGMVDYWTVIDLANDLFFKSDIHCLVRSLMRFTLIEVAHCFRTNESMIPVPSIR